MRSLPHELRQRTTSTGILLEYGLRCQICNNRQKIFNITSFLQTRKECSPRSPSQINEDKQSKFAKINSVDKTNQIGVVNVSKPYEAKYITPNFPYSNKLQTQPSFTSHERSQIDDLRFNVPTRFVQYSKGDSNDDREIDDKKPGDDASCDRVFMPNSKPKRNDFKSMDFSFSNPTSSDTKDRDFTSLIPTSKPLSTLKDWSPMSEPLRDDFMFNSIPVMKPERFNNHELHSSNPIQTPELPPTSKHWPPISEPFRDNFMIMSIPVMKSEGFNPYKEDFANSSSTRKFYQEKLDLVSTILVQKQMKFN